ncbi:adipolin [Nephila pilipes]|uniref:Adipolin n=1 Tax=Nephila pilipes TaxID=299642 RepID=A0A8X6P112_NEPPI|nr:adipolin [Nephila pilipes]
MPSDIDKDKRDFALLSWNLFQESVRQNEIKDEEEREKRKKRKNMRRKNLRSGVVRTKHIIGPTGPRGPVGPPGPPGANITKEQMFEEFGQMIRKLVQEELLHIPDSKISSLENNITKIYNQNALFEKEIHTPKVVTAFVWELQEYLNSPKSSRIELDLFAESLRPGALSRDNDRSSALLGRFEAPRAGYYIFNARLLLHLPKMKKSSKEHLSVSICISGQCDKKISLKTTVGVGNSEKMTVSTSGMLYLKVQEYVSIYIDNNSSQEFFIMEGSQFSGYLLGI